LVETAVKKAYQRIYSVLDKRVFHTLEKLNEAIWEIMEKQLLIELIHFIEDDPIASMRLW
jgi:hypothetical protein